MQKSCFGFEPLNLEIGPYPYKQILISFLVIKYFWEQYLNLRQIYQHLIRDVPEYLNAYNVPIQHFILGQSYSFDKIAFQMLSLSIRMAADVLCIMCNVLPFIWSNLDFIFPFIDMNSEFQRGVGFILIEAFMNKAFWVPLSAYQTFIIEKKYGFTNQTLNLFIYDLFIEGILMVIIFPPILYGYLRIVELGGEYFYLFIQVFALMVTILLGWIYPNMISPLFNEFRKLNNHEVNVHINHLAQKLGFPLKKILWMNGSLRSDHSNAYYYGFGNTKVIVLYDTLLQRLHPKQTASVVCHQLGHWKHNHSLKQLVFYLFEVLSLFYIFSFFLKNDDVFVSFGFQEKSTFIGTALFFHLFEPLASVFKTTSLVITRKCEFEADRFACEKGYALELKKSLIKLFEQSTSKVKPDWLYAWLKNSHPTVHERIQKIEEFIQSEEKNG